MVPLSGLSFPASSNSLLCQAAPPAKAWLQLDITTVSLRLQGTQRLPGCCFKTQLCGLKRQFCEVQLKLGFVPFISCHIKSRRSAGNTQEDPRNSLAFARVQTHSSSSQAQRSKASNLVPSGPALGTSAPFPAPLSTERFRSA